MPKKETQPPSPAPELSLTENGSQRKINFLQDGLAGDTNPHLRIGSVPNSRWRRLELSDIFEGCMSHIILFGLFLLILKKPCRSFAYIESF